MAWVTSRACWPRPLPSAPADVGFASRRNVSFAQFRKVLGLAVQPSALSVPPSGTAAAYTQFPLSQLGSWLHTFEVQPSSRSPLPPARHR
jgi:hypothetical protein